MKTNFLKNVKQSLFLFIAVLGTFVGFSQSTQNPTIGGSRTPGTGGLLDIGGKQTPSPTPFANLHVTTHYSLKKVSEIGGNAGQERRNVAIGGIGGNQPPSRRFCELCVGLSSDIGGQGTTRSYSDIGGNQAPPPRRVYKAFANREIGGGNGTSSDTGQISSSLGVAIFDTVRVTIGGKSSDGGLGKLTTTIDEYSILDIGGRGSDTGTGQKSATNGVVILSNSKSDIGGRSTGGEFTVSDIGGNQGPPRQICEINFTQENPINFEIGGQGSVPPRSVFEGTPIVIPIGGNSVPRA